MERRTWKLSAVITLLCGVLVVAPKRGSVNVKCGDTSWSWFSNVSPASRSNAQGTVVACHDILTVNEEKWRDSIWRRDCTVTHGVVCIFWSKIWKCRVWILRLDSIERHHQARKFIRRVIRNPGIPVPVYHTGFSCFFLSNWPLKCPWNESRTILMV